jgi:crossover junction endodeoxyribonuclease RuvC
LRLLALDLSLTSSGWARQGVGVVETGALRPGPRLSGAARLAWVCDRVVELMGTGEDRMSLVLLEGYSFGSQGRATFSIGELGGSVRLTLHRLGVPFVEVPPAVLKKFAVGSGQASKDEVLLAAARRGGDAFVGSSNDEADAFWLLVAGYAAAALRSASVEPLLRMPALQVAALEQVDWGPLVEVLSR